MNSEINCVLKSIHCYKKRTKTSNETSPSKTTEEATVKIILKIPDQSIVLKMGICNTTIIFLSIKKMDSVLHWHISNTGIIVPRQYPSQLPGSEEKEQKLKIHYAASAVNPAGWEGLLGIPTLKKISEMTESEIQ